MVLGFIKHFKKSINTVFLFVSVLHQQIITNNKKYNNEKNSIESMLDSNL